MRIRSLRGARSRTEFAESVGVSPLTVYRWELEDGAAEARRPRGTIARRLLDMEAAAAATVAPAPGAASPAAAARWSEPTAHELGEVLPLLERVLRGELRGLETELIALLSAGTPRSPAVRALATQALARHQLWARGDALGALGTLLPVLQQAGDGLLPPSVELEVHVTAALVFASFDGRVFDAGKVNTHVARAEVLLAPHADAQRFLLWYAQLVAANLLNDPPLSELVLARRDEVNRELPWMVLRVLAVEARLILGYFARRPGSAAADLAELLELTGGHDLAYFHVTALVQAARAQIDEGADPAAVLALVRRHDGLSREAGLAVGLHQLHAAYAEGEARFRAGELAAAEATWREGMRLAEVLRYSPGTLPFFVARGLALTGRADEIPALAAEVARLPPGLYPGIMRGLQDALSALAELATGASPAAALDRLDEAVRSLDQHGVWSFLRRNLALLGAAAGLLVGDAERGERALRHAERVLAEAPARWGLAAVQALRGMHLARTGRQVLARPALEAALAALEGAGDRVGGALVRHALALVAGDLGDGDAAERLARAREELAGLGVTVVTALERRAPPRTDLALASPTPLAGPLPAALARMCARGSSAGDVQRELVAAVHALAPGAAVRLEELEAGGGARLLAQAGAAGPPAAWIPLDASGRRLRLGVGAALAGELAELVTALAAVAGVALDAGALRALPPAATPPLDDAGPELAGFIASSPAMRRLKGDLARLARSRATIIVTGESGSGKEVVARAIHDLSVRATRPYVAFNCAAVPRELFEGQLFGYKKGAYTGAAADHAGVIRAAQGGTLFLDEIAELPLEVQPKLLRFLENGEVFPLGEARPVTVDVRVIAATFRDLEHLVREGRFREDLFYRLQVVPLRVPPLRERPEDVIALARFFIERQAAPGQPPTVLAPSALVALTSHPWPGNVRELRNVIERSLAFEPRPAVLDAQGLRLR